ncbi:MAG: FAD-dependent oxidoreductase [Oscillospiraceae bacterium]|nr:FAD-dependent oxidoreductase [Oscillospiraceae bacterium]
MKYVIIGNSAAGIGAVQGIRQVDPHGDITIVTHEPHHTYSRPLISYLLQGKTTRDSMKYRPDDFYAAHNCALLHGEVTQVSAGQVTLADGSTLAYDKLLVGTGASPVVPPIEGLDSVPNRFTFTTLDDALALEAALDPSKRVLIIGAGLVGLKCAEGILKRVEQVTVADLAPQILPAILDAESAAQVQAHLESHGVAFALGQPAQPSNEYDIVVLAVGQRPNTALLQGIAQIEQGIVVNDKSETTAANIYAAGDCTQTIDIASGQSKVMALLPNAFLQGECAGINMAGGNASFGKAIPMNAVGFFGLHIVTAGNYTGEVYTAPGKKLFHSGNRLNGFMLIGDVDKAGIYTSLIREQTPLDSIDFALICETPGLMAFTREHRQKTLGGEPT